VRDAGFALAVGLAATTAGALVSCLVPGPGFLAVWAVVALVVTVVSASRWPL